MCGIAGIVAEGAREYSERVSRMTEALRHRGPDGRGHWATDRCALGHTRLSIVDIAGGDQPMVGPGGRRAVVFNGEIYGFEEIREGFPDREFHTRSDTEVILALHERHGCDLLPYLPGMFAFALWDEEDGSLVAGRDRFGEKPFFYARGRAGEFVFGSEIKAILASGLVEPVLSREALAHYLRRRYVPPDRTIYSNIHSLPPAHRLRFADGEVTVDRYWSLPPPGEGLELGEAAERFRGLLSAAVRRQLVADVPVGAFLSGGLDSSTVVMEAARLTSGLRTLSFGFAGEHDERPFARAVATLHGTDHHEEEEIRLDIGDLLLTMQDVHDEPFGDSSAIPTWAISRRAREELKVVLTGDGADELLAGYGWWYARLLDMEREPKASAFRAMTLRVAAAASRRLGGSDLAARRLRGVRLRRELGTIRRAHSALNGFFAVGELGDLGLRCPSPAEPDSTPGETVDDALRMDLADYMPGEILVKTDRASMAHGLELRAPFLDVELATFLAALPSRLKIDESRDKILLREAYEADWPEEVRGRGKQGFGAPVTEWLARDDVQDHRRRILDEPGSPLMDVLPSDGVQRFAGEGGQKTWLLLNLGLWLEQHPSDLREFGGSGG